MLQRKQILDILSVEMVEDFFVGLNIILDQNEEVRMN